MLIRKLNNRNTINRSVIALAVITLTVTSVQLAIGWLQPVAANGDGSVRQVSVGIIPGQTIRLSIRCTQDDGPLLYSTYTYDQFGNLLQTQPPARVPAGGFNYTDISRRDLQLDGEPRTERLQVVVKLVLDPPPTRPSDVVSSVEIIDDVTGATTVVFTGLE